LTAISPPFKKEKIKLDNIQFIARLELQIGGQLKRGKRLCNTELIDENKQVN
jgi:hypothetical protein